MKKRKTCLFLLLLFLAILTVCNQYGVNGFAPHQEKNNAWMASVDDNTLLGSLTIPGTHNSCANYDFIGVTDTAKNQDLTLKQQLKAGVRFFDIRLSLDNGILKIHHGIAYQYMTFNDVWKICTAYLEDNPTETIIMAVQGEWNSEGNDGEIIPYIKNVINDDSHFYGATSSIGALKMSEIRGKILLVSRRPAVLFDTELFSTTSDERDCWNGEISTTDRWDNYYKPYLDSATTYNTNSEFIYSIWTNCYETDSLGIPNIRKASSNINTKLLNYLREKSKGDLPCAIVVDQITTEICETIFNLNF